MVVMLVWAEDPAPPTEEQVVDRKVNYTICDFRTIYNPREYYFALAFLGKDITVSGKHSALVDQFRLPFTINILDCFVFETPPYWIFGRHLSSAGGTTPVFLHKMVVKDGGCRLKRP
jgi:hypothetical protein